jgi:DNA polymerase-3 subunit epsilon
MSQLIEIVFDIETTGLHLKNGHKIIEIGCIELIDRKRTGRTFHRYINPKRKVDPDAIRVHGITDDFLLNKPVFHEIAEELVAFLQPSKYLVAHNGLAFDIKFLNHELRNVGLNEIEESKILDSLLIARKKFPGSPASLDALCKRFNVSLEKRQKHGALLDADLLTSIYLLMQKPQQGTLLLDDWEPQAGQEANFILKSQKERAFHLTKDDVTMHEEMLQKITDPLWPRYLKNLN